MESLNMNTLASSLPNSANAEKQLMDNFKAAALSITTLYRSSLDTSKRAYNAGYATCLLDVLRFVEAGVSVSGNEDEAMTIGRVMDWLEARLEAIKSTEEEAEEDRMKEGSAKAAQEETHKDEREKRSCKGSGSPAVAVAIPKLHRRSKEKLHDIFPSTQPPSSHRVPSPPIASPSHTSPSPPPPPARPIKQKRGLKEIVPSTLLSTDVSPFPVTITPSSVFSPFTFSSEVISAIPPIGSKRRHSSIISESPASSSIGASSVLSQGVGHGAHGHGGGRRKRNRGAREREAHHGVGSNIGGQGSGPLDTMDIEEEGGRERKRVARR